MSVSTRCWIDQLRGIAFQWTTRENGDSRANVLVVTIENHYVVLISALAVLVGSYFDIGKTGEEMAQQSDLVLCTFSIHLVLPTCTYDHA